MTKLIRTCQALVIATVLSAVMLSAHAATWFSCTGDTLCGSAVYYAAGESGWGAYNPEDIIFYVYVVR